MFNEMDGAFYRRNNLIFDFVVFDCRSDNCTSTVTQVAVSKHPAGVQVVALRQVHSYMIFCLESCSNFLIFSTVLGCI